jgi:hypothetical protein
MIWAVQETKLGCHICSPSNKTGGECDTQGEKRTSYRMLVGKSERKEPLGRPKHKWTNNVDTYVKE